MEEASSEESHWDNNAERMWKTLNYHECKYYFKKDPAGKQVEGFFLIYTSPEGLDYCINKLHFAAPFFLLYELQKNIIAKDIIHAANNIKSVLKSEET